MRRSIVLSLIATVCLTAASLLSTRSPGVVAPLAPAAQSIRDEPVVTSTALASPQEALELQGLPSELPTSSLEPARRDLFARVLPSAPPQPTPAASAVMAFVAPAPQAPALNARFVGALVNPEGQRMMYLARGDQELLVTAGQRLDDGYVVESVTAEAVTFLYPPLDLRLTLPIPAAPSP